MRPLRSDEISGNWATLLLPVEDNDGINYSKLSDEIDILITIGVNGIYSNGTAGEFYNQSEDEFDRISALLAEKCNAAGMPFQIGCSDSGPWQSLSRLKRARQLAPSAIQITLPDWFPPSMDEIIDYLRIMAYAAAPIGLVLYNPPHAKVRLEPEDFYKIQEAGIGLIGCKVGGGNKTWYDRMKKFVPELSLFVPGHQLATGISLGANGAYSNVACLNPAAAQRWYELMTTDMAAALELETRIQEFMRSIIEPCIYVHGYSNMAADKFLAAIGRWADIGTRLRWPYKSIPVNEAEHAREALKKTLPEFFM